MPLKVLTVDDSKTIRMIVKKAFKPFNCELLEAENGVEGLALASKEKPSLIILDITMPVMNGVEMLEKLKTEPSLKDIPVIMLTAESGKDNVLQIVKMGVKDYVVKPFKGEELIERVIKVVKLEPKGDEFDEELGKCFSFEGDIQILRMPEKLTRAIGRLEEGMKTKISEIANSGIKKLIVDLSKVSEINVSLIKLILLIMKTGQKSDIQVRLAGPASVKEQLKGFQETSSIPIAPSVGEAKADL